MLLRPDRLVFFDLETSGLSPWKHQIIQFAGVVVDRRFDPVEELEVKFMFDEDRADPKALEMNSFDAEEWAQDALLPATALKVVDEFLRKHATVEMVSKKGRPYKIARLAGHNIAGFDLGFLQQLYKSQDRFMPAAFQGFDTLQLALWCSALMDPAPENLKLETLCAYFGIELEGAHDALADVRANAALGMKLVDRFLS